MTDLDPRPYDVSLFDAPITAGTARKSDPWSSRESARRTRPAKDQEATLAALVANGGRGTLDDVCAALPDKLRNCLSRRLADLEQDGKVTKTGRYEEGRYGRPLAVWQVVR